MRTTISLGVLAMALFGCLFGRSPSLKAAEALPIGASIVVFDDHQGLVAVDVSSGDAWRWAPRVATADALRKVKYTLLGHTLLAREGLSLAVPVPTGGRDPSVAPDLSRFVYMKPQALPLSSIEAMNLDGSEPLNLTGGGASPTWLPDGTIGLRGGDQLRGEAIYRVNADATGLVKVVDAVGYTISSLEWSPDGARVAFCITGDRSTRIDVVNADGSGQRALIDVAGGSAGRPRWSPDGKFVAAMVQLPATRDLVAPSTLWVADAETGKGAAILDLPAAAPSILPRGGYKGVRDYAWSPDGRSIAFFAAMSGDCNQNTSGELLCRNDIYVVNRDGTGLRRVLKIRMDEPRILTWLP